MKKLSVLAVALILLFTTLSAMQETVVFEASFGSGKEDFKIYSEFWPQLPGPFDIDELGNFYICDLDNKRIQVFSKEGKHIRSINNLFGYNGFIHYSNNKIYFSGVGKIGYTIECIDLQTDSCLTYKKLYYENSINPINERFRYKDKLFLISEHVENQMYDEVAKISIISSSQYDTLFYNITKNINMKGFNEGLMRIIGSKGPELLIFNMEHKIIGNSDHYESRILKTNDKLIETYIKREWFEHFDDKPENFVVSDKGEIFAFIPIIIKGHIDKSGEYKVDDMKFQMIKYE